eukprot:EG_transcript_18126
MWRLATAAAALLLALLLLGGAVPTRPHGLFQAVGRGQRVRLPATLRLAAGPQSWLPLTARTTERGDRLSVPSWANDAGSGMRISAPLAALVAPVVMAVGTMLVWKRSAADPPASITMAAVTPNSSEGIPVRRIFLKLGCPFCSKVVSYLGAAGLADKVAVEYDTEANRQRITELAGKCSFPALEVSPGAILLESDAIIALYAKESGVDPATLPLHQ